METMVCSPSQKGNWSEELITDYPKESPWIVENLISTGLNTISGMPKGGKTILSTQICMDVITGNLAFGTMPTKAGKALYLALEEDRILVSDRIKKFSKYYEIKEKSFRIEYKWHPIHQGGLELLGNFILKNPDFRIIVIDVLARFRGNSPGRSYSRDYQDFSILQRMANNSDVAVVLLHHTTKKIPKNWQAGLYGTQGLPGVADTNILLDRPDFDNEGILRVTGRKGPTKEWLLKFNPDRLLWEMVGEFKAKALSPEREAIIESLHYGPLKPKEISRETGLSNKSIFNLLQKLKDQGLVAKHFGRYSLTGQGLAWIRGKMK